MPSPAGVMLVISGLTWLGRMLDQLDQVRRTRRFSRVDSRFWVPPLVLAAIVGSMAIHLPLTARFALERASLQRDHRRRRCTGRGQRHKGLPGRLPIPSGLYMITDCATVPQGGYIFYDDLGTAMVDYAGFAYLPNGIPRALDQSDFESPEFVRIRGPWYSFTASW